MMISTFRGFSRNKRRVENRGIDTLMLISGTHWTKSVSGFISKHAAILFQALFLCGGLIFGAVFSGRADTALLERLDLLFYSSIPNRISQPFPSVFISSAASSFLFVFACFLFGLSLWGSFLIPVIPLIRGFGFGLISGYLYAFYGLKGVLFQLLVILPGAYICILGILHAATEGSRFSRSLANQFFSKKGRESEPLPFVGYLTRFGLFLLIAAAAAVVDALTAVCFSGMFSFD